MIWGYIVLNLCLLAVLFWARRALILFIKKYPSIDNPSALEAFKNMVRWNMYGALAFLACGAVTWIWGYFIIMQYKITGFLTALAISLLLLIMSLFMKRIEERSRNLKCHPQLEEEYKRISQTWLKKAFPDF